MLIHKVNVVHAAQYQIALIVQVVQIVHNVRQGIILIYPILVLNVQFQIVQAAIKMVHV